MAPETRNGITADRCGVCGSVWFDASELDHWLLDHYPDEAAAALEERIPPRGFSSRRCPRCGEFTQTAGWDFLVLDQCRICGGLFVEAHELAQLERELPPTETGSFEARLKATMVSAGSTLLAAKGLITLLLRFLR